MTIACVTYSWIVTVRVPVEGILWGAVATMADSAGLFQRWRDVLLSLLDLPVVD